MLGGGAAAFKVADYCIARRGGQPDGYRHLIGCRMAAAEPVTAPDQNAPSRFAARRNFCGSTASPSTRVS